MNEKLNRDLLIVISKRGSLESLISKQISYTNIAKSLIYCELQGYINNTENGYELTEKGMVILNEKKSFEKIQPLEKYRIKTCVELDKVYIPNYIEGVIKELKN